MIKSFRDLEVYKESYQLMIEIHKALKMLPIYERNDLASQMRRCSKSCPANIAEGWAKRRFEKEFKKHLDSAPGSANEMEVHVETAKDLGYWQRKFNHLKNGFANNYMLLAIRHMLLTNSVCLPYSKVNESF